MTKILPKFEVIKAKLHDDLAHHVVKKYSVKKLCQTVGYNRSMFYRRFGSLPLFLGQCLSLEIKTHLNQRTSSSLTKQFRYLLIQMQQDRLYFSNVYRLVSSKGCVCDYLKGELYSYLKQSLLRHYGSYSHSVLKRLSNNVYRILYTWVEHDCQEKISAIYEEVSLLLLIAEQTSSEGLTNAIIKKAI